MLHGLLKRLTGNEVKIFMTILSNCNDRYEYINMESLIEFELSYPTVVTSIESLVKKSCIKKFDTGGHCILILHPDFRQLSDHIKKYSQTLELFSEEISEPEKKKVSHKDAKELIAHYAREQGVPQERMKEWNRANFAVCIKAAYRVLEYCDDLELAKKAVTNCRIARKRDNLEWSLGGDVMRNIQTWIPKSKGAKTWW